MTSSSFGERKVELTIHPITNKEWLKSRFGEYDTMVHDPRQNIIIIPNVFMAFLDFRHVLNIFNYSIQFNFCFAEESCVHVVTLSERTFYQLVQPQFKNWFIVNKKNFLLIILILLIKLSCESIILTLLKTAVLIFSLIVVKYRLGQVAYSSPFDYVLNY
jgi:hypothetical protein